MTIPERCDLTCLPEKVKPVCRVGDQEPGLLYNVNFGAREAEFIIEYWSNVLIRVLRCSLASASDFF
ncbi:hypothetical protein L596_019774 [Steinernema carpocapsae]|uniref:Uncharacterized protein n=1 Tax=Steinernema carpocapsae TaxID=34508 RepID=A0A4U5MSD7_STECR|nr:hypothetical protein L596_019774 [Steinernema carpocapsae]